MFYENCVVVGGASWGLFGQLDGHLLSVWLSLFLFRVALGTEIFEIFVFDVFSDGAVVVVLFFAFEVILDLEKKKQSKSY